MNLFFAFLSLFHFFLYIIKSVIVDFKLSLNGLRSRKCHSHNIGLHCSELFAVWISIVIIDEADVLL